MTDGSLYFTSNCPGSLGKRDIYRVQYLGNGRFDVPVNIGSQVNSEKNQRSTYGSADESFLILANTYTDKKGNEKITQFGIENWWVTNMESFIKETTSYMNIQTIEDTRVLYDK